MYNNKSGILDLRHMMEILALRSLDSKAKVKLGI